MISVTYANGVYWARKGLTGEVIYEGHDPEAMGRAVSQALKAMIPKSNA